jgi:signal transduction histidine kinase/ligand-binding sensor domain-containing protein
MIGARLTQVFNSRFAPLALFLLWTGPQCIALDTRLETSQYQKQHWQMEDGLPHNYVFTIQRAPDGYLLIGTDEGLARFDGMRFVPYDLHSALGLSKKWVLSMAVARDASIWAGTFDGGLYQWRGGRVLTRFEAGSSVFDIVEDSSGRIWASTRDGVIRSSGNGHFEPLAALRRPPDTAWNVLALDKEGAVWVVTTDGLWRNSRKTAAVSGAPPSALYRSKRAAFECVAKSGGPYGQIFSVQADAGGVMVGTSRGLYSVAYRDGTATLQQVPGVPGPVVAVLRDRNGNVWAGTWGQGLYRKNANGVQGWSSRDGLADDFVRQLYEDDEGNLWVGLRGGGLNRWKDPSLAPFGMREGLRGDYASTAAMDPQGRLWLGTWRGGLYRFEEGKLTSQPTPMSTLFFTVRTVAFDRAGHAWTGNWEGLFLLGMHSQHFGGPETPYRHVSVILFDRQQRLWIATSDNGLFVFPRGRPEGSPVQHLVPDTEVTSLVEDGDGRLWVGTSAGAGWISEAGIGAFHELAKTRGEAFAGLSTDLHGRIWGCTLGGSLWRLDVQGGTALDRSKGLPGYPLYLALDDGKGAMWISSARGILRIDATAIERTLNGAVKQVDYRLFDREDGMRTIECHRQSQPAGARDGEGRLWFPTSKGFVRIDPAALHQPTKAPDVRIEEATEDGKAAPGGTLRLPAGQHALEIRFTALEFSSPEKLRFRYRMEGLETDWTWANGSRTARYSRLPPGRFTFEVTAAVADGPWSRAETLAVEQAPEFYQTRWFAVLAGFAALLAALLIFRWQMHLFRQRYFAVTAERNRISREWHDTLLAGFSAISLQLEAAMLEAGQTSARVREILTVTRKMVQHYRAEARRVIWDLRESLTEPMSLESAVTSALRQAVEGREIAYEVNLCGTEIAVPKDVEHNLLRVCQEALSNAVRHGSPKRVRVDLRYGEADLTVRVEDDGSGFEPAQMRGLKNGHFGLIVMEERVQRFGGTMTLASRPGKGTVVEATVPVRSGKRKAAAATRVAQDE